MIIPDQSHINRVREALWKWPEGGASVLVGAGFSRNAKKVGPHTSEFPLWHEVSKLLCERLYPAGDGENLKRAISEASGSSGFLRLAQEYESAFGRGALHKLILEFVPDDYYVPDDIHLRLLCLPWQDVFTTNWDTLLERTLVTNRAYSVVHSPEELPSSSKPRIIKLHGSFPAHFPFIFTEEDYRTYPKRFAPFVNTVQQAMMETVYLLIGFSGDDPNFLHWSGWVRDNLGEYAPKIYLAGWLDLSPHRRRMLEDRNVVPIDVARHPKAIDWPEHLRHRYATEWIINTLEYGRPYKVTDWPHSQDWDLLMIPEILEPVERVTINAPVEEPEAPTVDTDTSDIKELVNAVISVWAHNRTVYPGWLFIPPIKHLSIAHSTNAWERTILKILPELPILKRLSTIYELVWRREMLLEPLSEQVQEITQAILNDIDCEKRTITNKKEPLIPWIDIRESWRNLAMSLLTSARLDLDQEKFDRWITTIQPYINDHPDVNQRLSHEKCLWELYNLNFDSLDKILKEWQPEGRDPAWMMRKAAILIETNRNDEAVRLINNGLSIVREAPRNTTNLAFFSREGWLLWLAMPFHKPLISSTEEVINISDPFDRLTQLVPFDCDARTQRHDMLNELRGDPEKKNAPLFDLDARRIKTILFSNAVYNRWNTARRGLRLCEVAGLPPTASHYLVASDILKLATDHLKTTDYALSLRIVLRIAASEEDEIFNRVWSRTRIATLPMQEINSLYRLISNAINYILPRVRSANARDSFWVTRLRVIMDALSRIVLRLPSEQAEDVMKQALQYYAMETFTKDFWLHQPIKNLLTRCWEALPKNSRNNLILDILGAPLGGIDGLKVIELRYPDPGKLFDNEDDKICPVRDSINEDRWAEIVHLIVRGLGSGGLPRKQAALRLVHLARWGILQERETARIAQALWQTDGVETDLLPTGTGLYDWVFLLLPEPNPSQAEERFRKKWLVPHETKNEKSLNNLIWQIGNSLASLRRRKHSLSLTEIEADNLLLLVKRWVELPVPAHDGAWDDSDISLGIAGLQFILSEIDLRNSIAEDLFIKIEELNRANIYTYRLYAVLYKFLPNKSDEIILSMRMGLASEKPNLAESATLGLEIWLVLSSIATLSIPAPPNDLLREIGVMIATRREQILNRALQIAKWVFSDGSSEQQETILKLTLHGLNFLIEELSYDREHSEEDEINIPLLRWGCAHLALAMSAAGYETEQAVTGWVDISKDDPLPEVRYAERPSTIIVYEKNSSDN